jgi:hypothetical protein
MEGRLSTDSGGGRTFLRDLSVSMLGEVARLAERECNEGAIRKLLVLFEY